MRHVLRLGHTCVSNMFLPLFCFMISSVLDWGVHALPAVNPIHSGGRCVACAGRRS